MSHIAPNDIPDDMQFAVKKMIRPGDHLHRNFQWFGPGQDVGQFDGFVAVAVDDDGVGGDGFGVGIIRVRPRLSKKSALVGRRISIYGGDPAREPLPDAFEPVITDVANAANQQGAIKHGETGKA